jgi:hypothetical protein
MRMFPQAWTKKRPRRQLVTVTFFVGFVLGEGLTTLSNAHNNLIGFGLLIVGLLAIWFQVAMVVRRERDAARARTNVAHPPGNECCVLQVHIHRGEILDSHGEPVDPDTLPEKIRSMKPFALRAQVDDKGTDLGSLAMMVRQFADDLDRTHHERVSQAN